jgi:hypothetical protein
MDPFQSIAGELRITRANFTFMINAITPLKISGGVTSYPNLLQ